MNCGLGQNGVTPGTLDPADAAPGTGALHALLAAMAAMTNADRDGRIIVDRSAGVLRYVVLNAAARFADVVRCARAVVLASGTLAPLSNVLCLFPGVAPSEVHAFSCGHVVSADRFGLSRFCGVGCRAWRGWCLGGGAEGQGAAPVMAVMHACEVGGFHSPKSASGGPGD